MIRIGVAGCGAIARQVHLRLLLHRRDARVTAVADADPARLDAACRVAPRARPHPDLASLLDDEVDAVVVCLPTGLHAPAAEAVLGAGKHLYLEKPLATTLAEGSSVLDAWSASDRVAMMGFNCRFNPLYRRLRSLLAAGRAGTPVYVRTVFATAPCKVADWKRSRATGGGALLDLASHHVDLLRFLFAREVACVTATVLSRHTEDDTALLELELAHGPRAHLFVSLAASELEQVEVHGDRARLSASRFTSLDVAVKENPSNFFGTLRQVARSAGALRKLGSALRARRAPLRDPGYALALDQFLGAVHQGGRKATPEPDLADGYACLAVIEAAERSSRTGVSTVPLPHQA
jgi:myo-inositol 2-dehydrogenase/D-chiro-inositol 1-dehydrogenase